MAPKGRVAEFLALFSRKTMPFGGNKGQARLMAAVGTLSRRE